MADELELRVYTNTDPVLSPRTLPHIIHYQHDRVDNLSGHALALMTTEMLEFHRPPNTYTMLRKSLAVMGTPSKALHSLTSKLLLHPL
jgi:hypothetical protein